MKNGDGYSAGIPFKRHVLSGLIHREVLIISPSPSVMSVILRVGREAGEDAEEVAQRIFRRKEGKAER